MDGIMDSELRKNNFSTKVVSKITAVFSISILVAFPPISTSDPVPWPAESTGSADHLFTDGRDSLFEQDDWSGAHWNPLTATLWLCRDSGQIRAYRRIDSEWSLEVSFKPSNIDAEAITQMGFLETSVFVLNETGPRIMDKTVPEIREYKTGGEFTSRFWRIPKDVHPGGGLEGMTFVPDSNLSQSGFVDNSGQPYTGSQFGLGGLFFLSAQESSENNGGAILAIDFDPNPDNVDNFIHVGSYVTPLEDPRGLEFDRSSNVLYVIDDSGEVAAVQLTSSPVDGHRALDVILHMEGPQSDGMEAIALPQKDNGESWVILLNDENSTNKAVVKYNDFDLVD